MEGGAGSVRGAWCLGARCPDTLRRSRSRGTSSERGGLVALVRGVGRRNAHGASLSALLSSSVKLSRGTPRHTPSLDLAGWLQADLWSLSRADRRSTDKTLALN
jgi:hypothetical protein